LFSISYAGLWGQAVLKLADFIPHAAKLGFESVMIAGKRPHLSPLDATEQMEPLKAALTAANVRCDVLGAYTNLAQPVGVGCEDLAFVNNEFGDPGILVVCGTNGEGAFYYTWVAGIPEVRVDPGNNNMGNTSAVQAYPGGDYALIMGWSGRHLWRFQDGLINTFNDAPWFQRSDVYALRFQQEGQRALIFGGSFGNPLRGILIEYRHDLYRCPNPFADCDFTDVSIPNFGAAPFAAASGTRLNDAGFRPGCDGGVLVGGKTDFNGSTAQLVKFQIQGARDCGP